MRPTAIIILALSLTLMTSQPAEAGQVRLTAREATEVAMIAAPAQLVAGVPVRCVDRAGTSPRVRTCRMSDGSRLRVREDRDGFTAWRLQHRLDWTP